MPPDPLTLAIEDFRCARFGQAEERCREMLARNPDDAEANHLLGALRFRDGHAEDALTFLARAAASPGASAEMHNHLGAALYRLGRKEAAMAAFERALAIQPGYADALNNMGVIYREEQKSGEAINAFRQAVRLKPELLDAADNLGAAYRDLVPGWHFAMMADAKRNAAYEAALRRAAPGKRVLDIGAGAGLLALMAARAGAAKVTSCESVPLIAERAREIVMANGLSDRIAVIAMKSTAMSVPGVMPERAELLVTETFASGLITEGVLPAVEHAHEYLLTPGAVVIPAAACLMGYLAGGPTLQAMLFVDEIAGFKLAAFNAFAPSMLATSLDHLQHRALSDDIELMRFDFRDKRFPPGGVRLALKATRHGVCAGIAQWIKLELDAQTNYDNRPSPQAEINGHWTHIVHRFSRLVSVAPGDIVPVLFRHDRSQISLTLLD
jgi:SAM-dependent methyltransferase